MSMINKATVAMTMPPRKPLPGPNDYTSKPKPDIDWARSSGVIGLLIVAAIFAFYAWNKHSTAFDPNEVDTSIHQILLVNEAILFAIVSGFCFVAAILIAIVKPLYKPTKQEGDTQ